MRTKETSWPIPNRTIASLKRVAQGILLEYGEGTSLASGPGSRRSMKIGRKMETVIVYCAHACIGMYWSVNSLGIISLFCNCPRSLCRRLNHFGLYSLSRSSSLGDLFSQNILRNHLAILKCADFALCQHLQHFFHFWTWEQTSF